MTEFKLQKGCPGNSIGIVTRLHNSRTRVQSSNHGRGKVSEPGLMPTKPCQVGTAGFWSGVNWTERGT
jgi:hypothetical protein